MAPTQHDLKLDIQGLLQHFVGGLYSEPEVFVRELVQNAHDSIVKRRLTQPDAPGQIRLRRNRSRRSIAVEDTGQGLDEQEIHNNLSTIGRSGTSALRDSLAERDIASARRLIGQFGIGVLSAFMVAREVEIDTLSATGSAPPLKWICNGTPTYLLSRGIRASPGTIVTLYVQPEFEYLLTGDRLRESVVWYADFIEVPIYLDDEVDPCNAVSAPWDRAHDSEQARVVSCHQFVARRYRGRRPLTVIPLRSERPCVRGVAFIDSTGNSTGKIDVYVRRMLVRGSKRDFLPPALSFVDGLIECPDLQPNTARDDVLRDGQFDGVRAYLSRAVIEHLRRLSVESPDLILALMKIHSAVKTNGAPRTFAELRAAARALPPGKPTVLYVARADELEESFRLLEGEKSATGKVLDLVDATDAAELDLLQAFAQRAAAEIDLRPFSMELITSQAQIPPSDRERWEGLRSAFESILSRFDIGISLKRLRRRLPAVLSLDADQDEVDAATLALQDPGVPKALRATYQRSFDQLRAMPVTLCLNTDNPAVQRLLDFEHESPSFTQAAWAIYCAAWVSSPRPHGLPLPPPDPGRLGDLILTM